MPESWFSEPEDVPMQRARRFHAIATPLIWLAATGGIFVFAQTGEEVFYSLIFAFGPLTPIALDAAKLMGLGVLLLPLPILTATGYAQDWLRVPWWLVAIYPIAALFGSWYFESGILGHAGHCAALAAAVYTLASIACCIAGVARIARLVR